MPHVLFRCPQRGHGHTSVPASYRQYLHYCMSYFYTEKYLYHNKIQCDKNGKTFADSLSCITSINYSDINVSYDYDITLTLPPNSPNSQT